jgi:microcystin-dependent protein
MVGELRMIAGGSRPPGWHVCDGSAISRAFNPVLFGMLGTTYGPGDGSTTFNLPNFSGRSPVGAGLGSGLTLRHVGDTGGEEAHALSTPELASHSHSVSDSGRVHTQVSHTHSDSGHSRVSLSGLSPVYTVLSSTEILASSGPQPVSFSNPSTGSASASITSTTPSINTGFASMTAGSTGSGTVRNTMHPFLCVTFIIALG